MFTHLSKQDCVNKVKRKKENSKIHYFQSSSPTSIMTLNRISKDAKKGTTIGMAYPLHPPF